MEAKATICFYRNVSPDCLIVRTATRRPGQPFQDVPSHSALILDGYLYEMIAAGFHARPAEPDDYIWSVDVPLPDFAKAQQAAFDTRETPYDWAGIAESGLSCVLPDRDLPLISRLLGDGTGVKHICSCWAASVLMVGGWPAPPWLLHQFAPASPNDLLRALIDPQRLHA